MGENMTFFISAIAALTLGTPIAASLNANPRFIICNSCDRPEDFSGEALKVATGLPGIFSVRVANADTGKIYIIDYEVKDGLSGKMLQNLISVARETAESEVQFMDIVKAVKSSAERKSK